MATRIRTLNFLPEIFQTPTNTQFLSATLDQIVDQPNTMKIEGYVGSKFGYGVNAKNKYVVEPTKTRTDYQLDPGVTFLKENTTVAQDFISYPGMIDALNNDGGITPNNNRLWNSQFYSWDSFTDLDKLINFHQYYWIPTGPAAVTVSTEVVFSTANFNVTDVLNGYNITVDDQVSGTTNPTLTLLRGGVYTFTVNQATQFWIQGVPGITGYDPQQPNMQTRDVFGVTNNGASQGIVTFTVPQKTDQDQYNFAGNNPVGVVSTLPFDMVNGRRLSDLGSIDGVTNLEGLTVMFYNTGIVNEQGFISQFFDTAPFDEDGGSPYTPPGTEADFTNYEGGYYTSVPATFYTITYTGSPSNPILKLIPATEIPTNENIYPQYGTQWIGRTFYRNTLGVISIVPYISAPLDTLYYQDGTSPDKVGTIRLIESNYTNRIDVDLDIIGHKTYTTPNGIVFTNGLKVTFEGDIHPASYKNTEYYVQGVGTAIELIPVSELIAPEAFTSEVYSPYDVYPYDVGNYDGTLYIPTIPDYITIARNSLDRNAWSRSNRWFHIDVINATASYTNRPELATLYTSTEYRAKRPIIEFYPNLKLFDSGVIGKAPIDFIDFRTTDAFSEVAGQEMYYPDVEVYTGYSAEIDANTDPLRQFTFITIPTSSITGTFIVGQYIADSTNLLPNNSIVLGVEYTDTATVLTVGWEGYYTFAEGVDSSIVAADSQLDQYALYDGYRIVFANDSDPKVRNKIYIVRFSSIAGSTTPIITLTKADDGDVLPDEQVVVLRGYNATGKDYWYYFNDDPTVLELQWQLAQVKTTVNQPPLFDIFDSNGVSFGDTNIYPGTSFKGNKLFAYGIGTSVIDAVLGFPLRYSSVTNVGDISFDVSLNIDTFNYVRNNAPITQNVNTGYVYNYSDLTTYDRAIGWQTAIGESFQYQVFEFNYIASNPVTQYTCDIAKIANEASPWQTIQVYVNNVLQPPSSYTVTTTATTTVVNFVVPDLLVDTIVQVLLLSDQVSPTAYYQVPINLNNNPLNQDIETLNIGDIRGQYQSIYYNAPGTTGPVFGANNFRDLGNLVPYGTAIVQNSASLVLPGTFLRKQNHSLFNALAFNSNEYINYKKLLINTVDNSDFNAYQTAAYMLDDVLDQISANRSDTDSFFWSDMVPSKAPYVSNSYFFANNMDTTVYPLTHVYDFDKANYSGVIVYVKRMINGIVKQIQLINNTDYIVSSTSKALTITFDLQDGDTVVIDEYNQTYGSFVPNTPTKLGLYPATIPAVVLDSNYMQPTYFIVGHDGSYTKLYGSYNTTTHQLQDYRDQVLLEFEKRIYNNLKIGAAIPVSEFEVLPGFFRDTDYTYEEILDIYSETFLNWVGQNRIDFKSQFYNPNDNYTFNYNQSGNKLTQSPFLQGYWRGIYEYFYDTSNPDTKPWEMLGFTNQPTWWETRYGPAPYTSDNLVLWGDLAAGLNWNDGAPYVMPEFVRNDLLDVIPVNSAGNLLSPFDTVLGNYYNQTFRNDWKVGDVGPVEFSYRRSSSWPFDLMRILALTKPAQFFNLGVDLDNYRYSPEFNQYLVNDRSHLVVSNIQIYGNGIAKTSYINWIVDFEKQVGVDATSNITSLLSNLDVRLVYRLAGFSDKSMLRFYVEKGTANSTNSSLLIPDESYSVLLYDNQPFDRIVYSGVIVQLTSQGYYKVYGNSQTNAFFKVAKPKINGNYDTISLYNLSVQVANDYDYNTTTLIPYGTEFYTLQEVAQFLESYGRYLAYQGVLLDQIETGIEVSWKQMIIEMLYWAQSGWEPGAIANLNPAAGLFSVNKDGYIVQPLTLQQQNFILNQNMYPISLVDMSINRDGTLFTAKPLNQGDTVAYGQFNISNFEHGIVFNNVTLFNDIIYNLITGLRQNRIMVRGTKSAEWDGTVTAQGFILNQDNIVEWSREVKYTKGAIVTYKNKYWTALKIIQAKEVFDEADWKQTDYNEVQKGLLPNSSTRSFESTIYYDVNKANLENDADLLSFSLIGYRPRDYLALADLTDITQVNVYKNLIKNKGTNNAVNVFKGAQLPQGGIDYNVYENWAIKAGEFGGLLNSNYVDMKLDETLLTGNPAIVGLTNGEWTPGVQQEVPLYSIYNYDRSITDPNVLPTLPVSTPDQLFTTAGYVNVDDIKIAAYFYSRLSSAGVPLSKLFLGDYIWIADLQGTWQVMAPSVVATISLVTNNNDGTVTVTFDSAHTLEKYSQLIIFNFDSSINGYYTVANMVDPYSVVIVASIDPNIATITGTGVALTLQSQRVEKPSDINSLPLLDKEFAQNKVWVDTNTDGGWAVYKKAINYQYATELRSPNPESLGTAVAHTSTLGYLVGDANKGEVYRYQINPFDGDYDITQTLTGGSSFGSTIAYSGNLFAVSQPTGATTSDRTVSLYELVANQKVNELIRYQDPIEAPSVSATSWGESVAVSGDQNWVFISDTANNQVYVYQRSTLTNRFQQVNVLSIPELSSTDNFGHSIATDFYGSKIVIGAPRQDYIPTNKTAWGYSYVFDRLYQNIEVQYSSHVGTVQTFSTYVAPTLSSIAITATSAATGELTTNSTASLAFGEPIVFTANQFGGLSDSTVYYVNDITSATTFTLATTKTTTQATKSIGTLNAVLVSSTSGLVIDNPVCFYGNTGTSNITSGTVYYIKALTVDTDNNPAIVISATQGGSAVDLADSTVSLTLSSLGGNVTVATGTGSMTAIPQVDTGYVSVNGVELTDNQYAFVSNTLYVYKLLTAGDVVSIDANEFVALQTLTTEAEPQIGAQFGNSLDITGYATEIIVGTPFEVSQTKGEGAVYRYTNSGAKFGYITSTTDCNVVAGGVLLINGYAVTIPANTGDASAVAELITKANITNVTAVATGNRLTIKLINAALATFYEKLNVSALDVALLDEMGVTVYVQTQVINNPHTQGISQFGYKVKFNDMGSFVVGAPVDTRYQDTTFDFIDDDSYANDTLFDNNTTQWIDTVANAGAVYMFDYIENYYPSLDNLGQFVYAQSTNASNNIVGNQPRFGEVIDFNNNNVVVGAPNFDVENQNGQVIVFNNAAGVQDWSVYRYSDPVVNIDKIQNAQIYGAISNQTLQNLDYFDPLQGKLLGAVRQNVDVVADVDPATYNSDFAANIGSVLWGPAKVGHLWLDTSTFKFINYHQNDVTYNSRYWGNVFPGSDVSVYSWVASNNPPSLYIGPGTPYNVDLYTTQYEPNSTGGVTPVYYFWVRNTNYVFTDMGKTLSDSTIQSYIAFPQASGITYLAPLKPNVFALYNCGEDISQLDSVLHIGFATGNNDDVAHASYDLIRADFADDFLPGLPTVGSNELPTSLYNRLIESFGGTDDTGNVVPDPYLPKPVQSGILVRPRQSFFYNRFGALKNYLEYVNRILLQTPVAETTTFEFLFTKSDEVVDPLTGEIIFPAGYFYDTTNYWSYVNWWAEGYNNSTKSSVQVQQYSDLSTLSVPAGTIVTVVANGSGNSETYIFEVTQSWTRIGLTNGTIQFSSYLWDYSTPRLGFGDNFFDTTPFDTYPSHETKYVIRAINEQLFVNTPIYRNKALILMFEYIQAETLENQNYLPWLNKTSFIDVEHTIRELLPLEVFQSDNQDFLYGYVNEVKPYHVVIKDFLFSYTGTDVWAGNITDFDLPAQYDSSVQQFISPELVYHSVNSDGQFLPTNPLWQTIDYTQWYQNYGLSLTGMTDYKIALLDSYITLTSTSMVVSNVFGFPTYGTIRLGDELISYTGLDYPNNTLVGLTRGVDGTSISSHFPGESVFIDLPGVVLLDSGRNYAQVPMVTAFIDTTIYPAPRREAVLEAVMAFDKILYINVIDPGSGYAVQPEILIDPSTVVTFSSTYVNTITNSISVDTVMQSGDLVQYVVGAGSTSVGTLVDGEYYYVGVLENSPRFIISLYNNYTDAINDVDRVQFSSAGTGSTQQLKLSAKAVAIPSSQPIRENKITMKFDRTSYTSVVSDWTPNAFYGSGFAEFYNNQPAVSSSNIKLFSASPDVTNIKIGAQGAQFEILDIRNDAAITWSSLARDITTISVGTNVITLNPAATGPNASKSTLGFYVGMPVKFGGSMVNPIQNGVTYYITEIVSDTEFKIDLTLTTPASGLTDLFMYTGSVVNNGVITIDYPGISEATATSSATNAVTIPMTLTGLNGTTGLYVGATVYFTGDVFGSIVENEVYYVNTIIDDQNITLTTNSEVLSLDISQTAMIGNVITTATNQILDNVSINDAVVFNDFVVNAGYFVIGQEYVISTLGDTDWNEVAGTVGVSYNIGDSIESAVTSGSGTGTATSSTFGNIIAGSVYYISKILTSTTFTITSQFNGGVGDLSLVDCVGNAGMTNQKNVVQLSTASGSMTMNVGLPISPGQVNGYKFTFYQTSQQYPYLAAYNTIIERTITRTVADDNKITLAYVNAANNGLANLYINMPFLVDSNIGNLTTGTTYYITDMGNTNVTVTNISDIYLTCSDTSGLFANMEIVFTGFSLGGILLNHVYYVKDVATSTTFSISETLGGPALSWDEDNGIMYGEGESYIKVSTTMGGSTFALANATGQVPMYQELQTAAIFDVSYILGGYNIVITTKGKGYAVSNVLTIPGASIGGTTPANDLVMTITEVGSIGEILTVTSSGTPNQVITDYYLKVISANECQVYSDPAMQLPVSGEEIMTAYKGVVSTSADTTYGPAGTYPNGIVLTDGTDFEVNDVVIFTGEVIGGIELGELYYVASKPAANVITITEVIGSGDYVLSAASGNMQVAKPGDFAFLPSPFYFTADLVKFNNNVYECIVSNNDSEFAFGKWLLVDSGDTRLNALDRINGYYQPTDNMPGLDLTQLVNGITYPNSTYLGNAFAPDDQFAIDVYLSDREFTDNTPAAYDIQGEPFTYGYGPEEMVPGIVSDNLVMTVNTRPGTNWDADVYKHVGYNVISIELPQIYTLQTQFSFDTVAINPSQISVFVIDGNTNLSTSIYDGIDYTVNWITKTVILNSPLSTSDKLRIDVYETGNGDQLVKSNSQYNPIRTNSTTGFNEIYLDCGYAQNIDTGSGVYKQFSIPTSVIATVTNSLSDSITCNSVIEFTVNNPIVFQGTVFGGIVQDQVYYVKSVNVPSKSITISDSLVDGVAGPIYSVTDDTGSMDVLIEVGNGLVWTDPIVLHNGTRLLLGNTFRITETKSDTNTVVCAGTNALVTGGMVPDQPIVFGDDMFGTSITPMVTYYVKDVVSYNAFTISETLGGPVLVLDEASGGSLAITNDYSFALNDNGSTANMIFAAQYDQSVDFLAFTVFGETVPEQYGYALPETQTFVSDGSTGPYVLTNYNDGENPTNAVVEVNGVRLADTEYTLDNTNDILTLVNAPIEGQTVAITTYNDTARQAFNTQYSVTGVEVASIVSASNNVTAPSAVTNAYNSSQITNEITVASTDNFVVGQTVVFTGTSFDESIVDGTVYFVQSVTSATTFTIMDQYGNQIAMMSGSGIMLTTVGGQPTERITVSSGSFATNDLVRITGTGGSIQLNNNAYYIHVITDTVFDLYLLPYNSGIGAVNHPVTDVSTYVSGSGGFATVDGSLTVDNIWTQFNVDRLWVTVNGYRVPSSLMTLFGENNLNIQLPITTSDEIIITSMMPSATPNELTYMQTVNKLGEAVVYRANSNTRTWLTADLNYTDEVIYVDDITRITDQVVQYVAAPGSVDGITSIGLTSDKNTTVQVTVYNTTTESYVYPFNYYVEVINLSPMLQITNGVSEGDNLVVISYVGNTLYVGGEQIKFNSIDLENSSVTGLQRGINGTAEQAFIPKYAQVYGFLPNNVLNPNDYDQTWNSDVYNPVEGDPLQISETPEAAFLNTDIS